MYGIRRTFPLGGEHWNSDMNVCAPFTKSIWSDYYAYLRDALKHSRCVFSHLYSIDRKPIAKYGITATYNEQKYPDRNLFVSIAIQNKYAVAAWNSHTYTHIHTRPNRMPLHRMNK